MEIIHIQWKKFENLLKIIDISMEMQWYALMKIMKIYEIQLKFSENLLKIIEISMKIQGYPLTTETRAFHICTNCKIIFEIMHF